MTEYVIIDALLISYLLGVCMIIVYTGSCAIYKIYKHFKRKNEEQFFQRQYIDDNFKDLRNDLRDMQHRVVENQYKIENIEEKLNNKENKKNVKKKKRN